MNIQNLKTNHKTNPLGNYMEYLLFSWTVTGADAETDAYTRIRIGHDDELSVLLYDSGELENYGLPYYYAEFSPEYATRYYWTVEVKTTKGTIAVSEPAWFETALAPDGWKAKWIGANEGEAMPYLYREFEVKKEVKSARLYCCGLGLYEAYLDGEKIGGEFLAPGYHSYDLFQQYQTYDVTELLSFGKNTLGFLLGEGWYKGRFVFEGGYENLYGERKMVTAMLCMEFADGSKTMICTDEYWKGKESSILKNNIYDGEWIDRTRLKKDLPVEVLEASFDKLTARRNVPMKKVAKYPVKEIIHTPKGDTILDFGEAITGWVEVYGRGEMNFKLQYAELMQEGEFFTENLRTAQQIFSFQGAAEGEWLRPHFTYYGFRYVKVTGMNALRAEDFVAYRLMSEMEKSGFVETSNEKVNQLFANTVRSQECNFLDIPTDCPQRDERMGWTGDIGIFARTASFHYHTGAFLDYYMINLQKEQSLTAGAVPFFVPRPKPKAHEGINLFLITEGACTWGDAATIVPWELYLHYQDKKMLCRHYVAMQEWVKYIRKRTTENRVPFLWQNDRHLGDWLALDNGNLHNPIGKTDMGLIASAYYYYSVKLCKKAANVLGKEKDAEEFAKEEANIRTAFLKEFLDESGDLKVEKTQTAYALLLYFGLYEEEKKQVLLDGLQAQLREYQGHLSTGFVGTAFLLQALAENGLEKEAYELLLTEEYPGWLREVNLGATTTWERWNSLSEDGTISGDGMNSLNHYAYGSVAGWMYEDMCGFRWDDAGVMYLKPIPCSQIKRVKGSYRTVYGELSLEWKYEDNLWSVMVDVPFQMQTKLILPWGEEHLLKAGSYQFVQE